jgi:hypothetical protein
VAVGFAVGRELIEGLEGLCDFSDAAYEQDCFSISKFIFGVCWQAGPRLTAGENHPDEVHEEIISPEVQEFGS